MMIGKGPYANQFGVLMPVIAVNIPGTPPTSEFLKKLFQARASVHDGMIYGMMKRVVIIFFHFIFSCPFFDTAAQNLCHCDSPHAGTA